MLLALLILAFVSYQTRILHFVVLQMLIGVQIQVIESRLRVSAYILDWISSLGRRKSRQLFLAAPLKQSFAALLLQQLNSHGWFLFSKSFPSFLMRPLYIMIILVQCYSQPIPSFIPKPSTSPLMFTMFVIMFENSIFVFNIFQPSFKLQMLLRNLSRGIAFKTFMINLGFIAYSLHPKFTGGVLRVYIILLWLVTVVCYYIFCYASLAPGLPILRLSLSVSFHSIYHATFYFFLSLIITTPSIIKPKLKFKIISFLKVNNHIVCMKLSFVSSWSFIFKNYYNKKNYFSLNKMYFLFL